MAVDLTASRPEGRDVSAVEAGGAAVQARAVPGQVGQDVVAVVVPLRVVTCVRAKQVRRDAMRHGGAGRVREEALRAFGLPPSSLGYVGKLTPKIYAPSRSANS